MKTSFAFPCAKHKKSGGRNKVRVLHLITGLGRGGAEAMLLKLLVVTDRERFEPSVISLSDAGVYGAEIEKLGIPVFCLGMRGSFPGPHHWLRLRSLIKALRPSVMHCWMYHAALAGLSVAGAVPLIIAIRQTPSDLKQEKFLTGLIIRILGWVSGRAASITYNSYESQKRHSVYGYAGYLSKVIPNGFDVSIYKPDSNRRNEIRKALRIHPNQIAVFQIARFHPMKGHMDFINAIQKIDNQDLQFFLLGTGVSEDNLSFPKLSDGRVHLLGERSDVSDMLQAADILVSPSVWGEGFPNVIGEAMACGVPCVATDVGDSAYVIGDMGAVVPPGDPDALANAIEKMVAKPADELRTIGKRARQRVIDHFSISKVAEEYQALYQSLLV